MSADGEQTLDPPSLTEQVGLAVRAWRQRVGLSQRGLAEVLGRSQSMISRLETRAGELPLGTVQEMVELAGFELVVVREGRQIRAADWERTDLVARDRSGRRFPAQRRVYPAKDGPYWWWEQEYLRLSRPLGPQPVWTTVGLDLYGRREEAADREAADREAAAQEATQSAQTRPPAPSPEDR
ncbi:helix-turn-helix domain-containing protein [Ornithinimicrobium faecis]|uniref:Helix-turn-helix domain-containing protein n=1 Tax=Ornithinimicrobium faecis TaxID=2934158 RepID=A0ABY4YQT5_9MICO|nr:helix-turn-helix transcriptional regulator [Ornithinimicrobium sp. HY1793]USQ79138.1 helix-turn-helix domain-containing protein [Ornithinimicrobium sp. HY1793]